MTDRVDEWLAGLDEDDSWYREEVAEWSDTQRERANELIEVLGKLGAQDPGLWAFSEVDDNSPQCTRYAFLKGITRILEFGARTSLDDICDQCADHPVLKKAISRVNETTSSDERAVLIAAIGKYFASQIVHLIDQGESSDLMGIDTLWSLEESDGHQLTGRPLSGLHEDDDGDWDGDQEFVPGVLRS